MFDILRLAVGIVNLFSFSVQLRFAPATIRSVKNTQIAMRPAFLSFRKRITVLVFSHAKNATDADALCTFARAIKRCGFCGWLFAVRNVLLSLDFCLFSRTLRHFLELLESIEAWIGAAFHLHDDGKPKLVLVRIGTTCKTAHRHPHRH